MIDWYLDWHQTMIDFWRAHETLLALAWTSIIALGIWQAVYAKRHRNGRG